MRICFISDLHLFSRRSRADSYLSLIRERIASADTVVLGGDLFDFKWSTLASTLATCHAAVAWLETLMGQHPGRRYVMLLGNHDDHPRLVEMLEALAVRRPEFRWERYYFRQGTAIFLHGDAATPLFNRARLEASRTKEAHHRRKGRVMNALYGGTVRLRLHVLGAHVVFPRRLVARRILRYLVEIGHGPASGVRNVYYGHTHLAIQDFPHRGLRFHNGGAPMDGLRFEVLEADLE